MTRVTSAMLEQLFEQAPDGFFFMLLDAPASEPRGSESLVDRVWQRARLRRGNAALARQHGVAPSALIGRSPAEMFGTTAEEARTQLRALLTSGGTHVLQAAFALDGHELWLDGHYRVLYDVEGRVLGYLGVQRDVTHVRRLQDELEQRAATDPLTGAGNRRLLEERFEHHTVGGARRITLLYIDLDGFKRVNDHAGHVAGDLALARYTERLRALLRAGDTLVRIGGDEFVVLAPHASVEDDEALVRRVSEPAELGEPFVPPVTLTCSVGVAHYPSEAADLASLLELADRRMYQVKALRSAAAPPTRAPGGRVRS